MALCFSLALAMGCAGSNEEDRNPDILAVYNTYVVYAEENGQTPLSYEDWLASIKGDQGIQGEQGEKGDKGDKGDAGETPTIEIINGYWYVNGVNTSVKAEGKDGVNGNDGQDGEDGKDGVAPTIEIIDGYWHVNGVNTSVKAEGKDGVNGNDGQDGEDGKDGVTPTIEIINGYWYVNGVNTSVKAEGKDGQDGKPGKSAYQIYKEIFGYEGTEEEWLIELINGTLVEPTYHTVSLKYNEYDSPITQKIKHGEKVARPENPSREGYVFEGWVYFDGVEYKEWSFGGYVVTEDITIEAKWRYETLELPIVNINTFGAGITSKVDYTEMEFTLENCDGELSEVTGGIRLRGNTTKNYPKKPYRIKFDKKQSLFGLTKAKSWVLLADYLDPSAFHNHAAMSIASEMPGLSFTPTPNKVNVYLNGEFQGLYTLCEQVQENEGRMNIELDEITADMQDLKDFNFYICMDMSSAGDIDAVLDETYFYIEEYDRYFELKYPEKDDFVSEEQFRSFFTQLKTYIKNLLDSFTNGDLEVIKSEANINSLVDFLIVDQIMGEIDHSKKSFNMYFTNTSSEEENGKINFGPVWDYDWCLYTDFTGKPNEQYAVSNGVFISPNPFYRAIYNIPEFLELIKERYALYGAPALEKYLLGFDELVLSLQESIELNRELWYLDYDEEIVEKNIQFLKEFLLNREKVLGERWQPSSSQK